MSTELIEAVKRGDLEAVQRLALADPTCVDAESNGVPAVRLAVYYGQPQIAAALAGAGARLDVFSAAALGRLDAVQAAVAAEPTALGAFSSDGFPPLGLAAFFGHANVADWLLDQGADANAVARNPMRVQPLHSAAAGGHLTIALRLLEHGAEVNARQEGGFVPLHAAAQNGQPDMTRLLLAHGADPDLATDDGKRAVDFARDGGHAEVLALLATGP